MVQSLVRRGVTWELRLEWDRGLCVPVSSGGSPVVMCVEARDWNYLRALRGRGARWMQASPCLQCSVWATHVQGVGTWRGLRYDRFRCR